MVDRKIQPLFTLIGIFMLSTSLFLYEILITRLFSTMLFQHLVFFTISLAVLGIGIGGFIVYKTKIKISYEKLSLLLGVSYIGIIITIYKLPYIGISIVYALVSSIPFVIGGMILSLVFLKNKGISNKLYFADLLGSTLGSILIIPLMNNFGFMKTTFIIGSFALVSSLSFVARTKYRKIKVVGIVSLAAITLLLFQGGLIKELEDNFTAYYTSPNTLINHIREQGNEDAAIPYTNWDSVSRIDVIEKSKDVKVIITDGGASAPMLKFDGDLEKVTYLKNEIEFLPFSIGDNENTLLIGPGGGKDILFALLGGSKNIDAVEINPATIEAATRFKDFNGDIYNYKGVNTYIDDGRNFIENIDKEYNNIYMAMVMTNTVNNSGLSMSENYIYTKEAYKAYFNHLKDDGYLSFMFHGSSDMLKGVNTGIEVLLDMGIKREEIPNHFAIVNSLTVGMSEEYKDSIDMPVVVFKKQPFSTEEIENISNKANEQKRVIINIPEIEYMDLYKNYSEGVIELKDIYKYMPFNIIPPTDDRPFFFDDNKAVPLNLLGLFLILLLIIMSIYKKIKGSNIYDSALYFGTIGIGFMLIEIPLIQKSSLFLGNPTKAFGYVLFSLLLSCGIGSYFSNKKVFDIKIKNRQLIFLLIPIMIILVQISLPFLIVRFRGIEDSYKLLMLTCLLFPLGFFLGMAFPKGISKLSLNKQEQHIPLMWGINGVMSVMGSVLALVISMKFGFNAASLLGGLMYLSIFIFKY